MYTYIFDLFAARVPKPMSVDFPLPRNTRTCGVDSYRKARQSKSDMYAYIFDVAAARVTTPIFIDFLFRREARTQTFV